MPSDIGPMRRIYIVDDDPDIRQMLGLLLRSAGYATVGQSGDGLDILRKLKAAKPGIVLLDISLPGVSGLEVLKDISQTYPNLKVIMISGSSASEDVQKSVKLGAVGYIVKPFSTGQVVQNIERAIHSAKQEKAVKKDIAAKEKLKTPDDEKVSTKTDPRCGR